MPAIGVVFDNGGFYIGVSRDGSVKEELKHLEHKMFPFKEEGEESIEAAINEAKNYLLSKGVAQSEIDDVLIRFARICYFHKLVREEE